MKNVCRMKMMIGGLVLAGGLLTNPVSLLAQDYGYTGNSDYAPAGQLDSLVTRIALYPDPLLAQIFAAAAFPDQIVAAAQGSGGPFDPSVEALMQYPSVLQMMASDPGWTQALGQAVMQDQGAVMDAIQNLRREAQQYGYLQSGPQMQVVDDGGYIGIQPAGGYMYVPIYDPYVVFARPRPGFFLSGAIRFGGGFRWVGGGYNRFNWRRHEVVVNRRVWTPPIRRTYEQRPFEQRRFEGERRNFTRGNPEWNRNYTSPAIPPRAQRSFTPEQPRRDFGRPYEQRNFTPPQPTPQQRSFTPEQSRDFGRQTEQPRRDFGRQTEQPRRDFGRPYEQRNFTPPQPTPQPRSFTREQSRDFGRQPEQRNFTAPRQMEQRTFNPQPRNQSDRFERGGQGRGRWR